MTTKISLSLLVLLLAACDSERTPNPETQTVAANGAASKPAVSLPSRFRNLRPVTAEQFALKRKD